MRGAIEEARLSRVRGHHRQAANAWGLALLVGLLVLAWALKHAWPDAPPPTPATPATPAASTGPTGPDVGATVEWIVDGDTLDVLLSGTKTRVRLINIDAPEIGHEGAASQCLADQAKHALGELAPPGTTVALTTYGHDRYGRLLAGLSLTDGRLVNAEIVRLGLTGPLVVDGQKPLLDAVDAARDQATTARAGLHGAASCSVPGRLASARAALDAVPPNPAKAEAAALVPGVATAGATASDVSAELHADARDALVQGLTPAEFAQADAAASQLKADADATLARLRAIG